jgi:hypothetical protein
VDLSNVRERAGCSGQAPMSPPYPEGPTMMIERL